MTDTRRNDGPGLPPGKWEEFFRKAGVQVDGLDAAKSGHAKATILGNFLSQNLGREVPIKVGDRWGRARLCVRDRDKKQRHYYLEVRWDRPSPADSDPTAETAVLDDGLGLVAPEQTGLLMTPPVERPAADEPATAPLDTPDESVNRENGVNQEIWE